ncbi:2OG-Fe(II) oxygenase [Chamaesiphon minutus]|uniref:Putative proline hydroxylase n=1 Tax=Chamaesiphon minutus (strain ATCC 27169 / PCC 6605) TaxID=1173020 RepID=K9ULI5_CHAP6|nr:2OG-Fe(II) oxygenase [Chamaesiphon minutus]AFY95064.1 putative proline hydroxylase [Chamaesiphon minutus PCC 6605]
MSHSFLTDYIKLVRPHTSPSLISEQTWDKINNVAEFLPNKITSFFGFECPLGIATAQSDFLICAEDTAGTGREILADKDRFPTALLSDPVWQQVTQFGREWQDENSILYQKIHNVWLEFDLDGDAQQLPVPSCFFGSEPIYAATSPYANPATPAYCWVSESALKHLLNDRLPERVEAKLFECFDCLPPEAYVFQIGLMLARNIKDAVRVCIRDIAPAQIGEYLQKIGWPGSVEILQEFVREIADFVERIDLDIDISDRVLPKIGFECYFSKQPKLEPRWQIFLDYLERNNLCLPQKRAGLLAYPGFLRESAAPNDWPSYLSRAARTLENNNAEAVFFRKIHHIKIVYQDDRPQLAKAYLAMGYRSIDSAFVDRWRKFTNSSVQIDNFIEPEVHDRLLKFVRDSQAQFMPSEIGIDNTALAIHRRSSILESFPEFEKILNRKIAAILPDIFSKLGLPDFPIERLETQLTAHNDGDYYRVHNDSGTTESSDRILTYVYYFYQEPKAFSGGELRIYETNLNTQIHYADSFQTIEPRNNSIVFFPSAYMHEVLKINCPSQAFADSRFTMNGWVWRKKSN